MSIPASLLRLASKEALRFLDLLGISVEKGSDETADIVRIAATEYDDALIAARIMVADKALALIGAVKAAVETGEIPAQWDRADKVQQVITTGLTKYDPRIAFQATLRSSYNAGRYHRGMEQPDQPYFLYRTMRDSRVRQSHAVLNGVYLPKDHVFWSDHYAPNGWNCRCKVIPINQAGIDKLANAGLPLQDTPPEEEMVVYKDKTTGEETTLPASIEPGWNYNPGTAAGQQQLAKQLQRRMAKLSDPASI